MNITQFKNKVVSAGFDEETTRVLLGLEFQIHGDQAYVDSLQIAELLEVNHRDLLVTIRNFIKDETEVELDGNFEGMRKFPLTPDQPISGLIETTFQNPQNKQRYPMYLINEENALIISMKSNSKNATRIRRIIAKGFLLLRDLHTQQTQVFSPREESVKIIKSELDIYALLEVPLHLAQIESIKTAKAITGIDHSDKLKLAPAQNNIKQEEIMLEPKDLEIRLGIGKQGSKINKVLVVFGYQAKINEAWTPTDKAAGKYSQHAWTSNGKSGYNYKWNYNLVKELVDQLITNYGNIDAALKELTN